MLNHPLHPAKPGAGVDLDQCLGADAADCVLTLGYPHRIEQAPMTDNLSLATECDVEATALQGGEPPTPRQTETIAGETVVNKKYSRILWQITPRHLDGTRVNATLARREFAGLAIDVVLAERPWEQRNELVLYVNGKPYTAPPAMLKLLFCLLEQPGCVYSFAQLCHAVGLSGRNARRNKCTLVEHARRCRLLLAGADLPLYIAVVSEVGYALCRRA